MAEIIFGIDHGNGNRRETMWIFHVDWLDILLNLEDL